jgi:hypothetical protein
MAMHDLRFNRQLKNERELAVSRRGASVRNHLEDRTSTILGGGLSTNVPPPFREAFSDTA